MNDVCRHCGCQDCLDPSLPGGFAQLTMEFKGAWGDLSAASFYHKDPLVCIANLKILRKESDGRLAAAYDLLVKKEQDRADRAEAREGQLVAALKRTMDCNCKECKLACKTDLDNLMEAYL